MGVWGSLFLHKHLVAVRQLYPIEIWDTFLRLLQRGCSLYIIMYNAGHTCIRFACHFVELTLRKGPISPIWSPPPIAPLVSSLFQPTEFDILISDNSVQIRTVSTRSENPIKTALRSVWSFLGVSFNTVPQVVWLTMTLSRRFGLGSRHPLPTPFTFRRWTVWDPWLRACQVVS